MTVRLPGEQKRKETHKFAHLYALTHTPGKGYIIKEGGAIAPEIFLHLDHARNYISGLMKYRREQEKRDYTGNLIIEENTIRIPASGKGDSHRYTIHIIILDIHGQSSHDSQSDLSFRGQSEERLEELSPEKLEILEKRLEVEIDLAQRALISTASKTKGKGAPLPYSIKELVEMSDDDFWENLTDLCIEYIYEE